jgi:hypothetical protein
VLTQLFGHFRVLDTHFEQPVCVINVARQDIRGADSDKGTYRASLLIENTRCEPLDFSYRVIEAGIDVLGEFDCIGESATVGVLFGISRSACSISKCYQSNTGRSLTNKMPDPKLNQVSRDHLAEKVVKVVNE